MERKLIKGIFILIFVTGIWFTFLVPAFQKPDEEGHFKKALAISKGYFYCNKPVGNTLKIEKKFANLFENKYLKSLPNHPEKKFPFVLYNKEVFADKNDQVKIDFIIDDVCRLPVISYIPQAIGLTVSSFLNLNEFISFFLGRFFMFLLGFVWFLFLFKNIKPIFQKSLLFTFSLPMTIHQVSSYTHDAINILLALTFFTLLVNSFYKEKITSLDLFKLFLTLVLFFLSKYGGYEFFILFLLLIPYKKIEKNKAKYMIKIGIVIFFVLASVYLNYHRETLLSARPQIQYLSQSQQSLPATALYALLNTTPLRAIFYTQGLIGIFGYLDYSFPHFVYFLYIFLILYLIYTTSLGNHIKFPAWKIILLLLTLVAGYSYIVVLFYFLWTPLGSSIANGIQGRYFIVYVPFILLLLASLKNIFVKKVVKKDFYYLFHFLIILCTTILTFYIIWKRYYI